MRTLTRELQSQMTPDRGIELLKEGNRRFVENLKLKRNLLEQINETSDGQYPFAVILSCIDSRTSAELIFDQGLGDIFSVRIAGNILNDDILGSMEFGCKIAGSKVIVVLGHTRCGAIKGACDNVELGNLTKLLEKIKPAIEAETSFNENRNSSNEEFVTKVTQINVQKVKESITEQSPVLAQMLKNKEIKIISAIHDVTSGEVVFKD